MVSNRMYLGKSCPCLCDDSQIPSRSQALFPVCKSQECHMHGQKRELDIYIYAAKAGLGGA